MELVAAAAESALAPLSDLVVTASQPYIGQWQRLVSTTNWDKGRIIEEWRRSLIAQELPIGEYSDEAWGRLVGGVTGQHVGRLRRVYQRFGKSHDQFPGLYWSHFQAALDWQDAEMWLEGAVKSDWSVAQMRDTRWRTLDQVEADRPRPEDVIAAETDEDFEPSRAADASPRGLSGEYSEITGPRAEDPDFGDAEFSSSRDSSATDDYTPASHEPVELVRPFENLPDLPDDLADAFDALKLAILHHKTDNWRAISAEGTLRALDALKALVLAPSTDAPF